MGMAAPGIPEPSRWDQMQMFAGWKQASIKVLLGNARQLLFICPAVKFSTYSFILPFPKGLSSTREICGSATRCVYLHRFTCTPVCTQLLGRIEWCSNKLLQCWCVRIHSLPVPTFPTFPSSKCLESGRGPLRSFREVPEGF